MPSADACCAVGEMSVGHRLNTIGLDENAKIVNKIVTAAPETSGRIATDNRKIIKRPQAN